MAPVNFENMCFGTRGFKTQRLKNHHEHARENYLSMYQISYWHPLIEILTTPLLDSNSEKPFMILGGHHGMPVEECIGVAQINIDKLMMRQLLVGWYKLFPPFDHR